MRNQRVARGRNARAGDRADFRLSFNSRTPFRRFSAHAPPARRCTPAAPGAPHFACCVMRCSAHAIQAARCAPARLRGQDKKHDACDNASRQTKKKMRRVRKYAIRGEQSARSVMMSRSIGECAMPELIPSCLTPSMTPHRVPSLFARYAELRRKVSGGRATRVE